MAGCHRGADIAFDHTAVRTRGNRLAQVSAALLGKTAGTGTDFFRQFTGMSGRRFPRGNSRGGGRGRLILRRGRDRCDRLVTASAVGVKLRE